MRIVGIDGGGTKTDGVLCDETGRVLRRVRGGPGSPTSQPMAQAVQNINAVVRTLMQGDAPIDALYAGLSGGSVGNNTEVMRRELKAVFPQVKNLGNHTDAINALRSAIPSGDALVAICGTGSSVFAQVGEELHQVGGWGHLVGDEGSGFDLGRRALNAALRELDGRGPHTALTVACRQVLGQDVTMAIPDLYVGGRALVASFGVVLLEQAEAGDAIAVREFQQALSGLAEQIVAAGRFLPSVRKPVALAGSVWQNDLYRNSMQRALGENYVFHTTDLPPVYGSFAQAMGQLGLAVTDEVEKMFCQTLAQAETIAADAL
jgi:N-acetylglucosamine kinase-like BadF-type ATPase